MKSMMMQKAIYFLFIAILYSCSHSSAPTETPANPPNIIIVFTDDQGYQDLGCYGSPDIATPHLDQMAKEGMRFTNFYVSQPVCSASRASLLTGCYANRVSIHNALNPYVKRGLNTNETTIAEMLKSLGYATAIYGKWHLGSEPEFLPTRQGFDEYYGIPYSNDMWKYHPENESHKFGELPLLENETIIDTLHEQSMITTQYTERAVEFIKKNKDQPFFLYLPHSMPHVPLFVSDKFKGKSPRGLYGDVISEIDWSVGQILQTLKDQGIDNNSLVIFTSDNGPWLSYGSHSGSALPLREGKGTALEGGVRVPCIMRWPDKIPSNSVINDPAMTIDLLPTIASITGAPLPQQKIDGKDMLDLLTSGEQAAPHHDAYYFYYRTNELHAVMSGDGRWKLYLPHTYRSLAGQQGREDGIPIKYDYSTPMGLELYDLQNDIRETTDVSAQHPDILEALLEHAEKARTTLGDKLTDRIGTETRPAGKL